MKPFQCLMLAGCAALAAGCAATGPPGDALAQAGRECFRANMVNSFMPAGDNAVNVRVSVKDWYRLELIGHCPDIDWSHQIALVARGSSWVCRGHDADLIVPAPGRVDRCTVRSVRKLSEAEVAALRGR